MVRAAEKINRRFNVSAIIEHTGIDPVTCQDPKNLFINYLSDEGRKEFALFEPEVTNIKQKFDDFKKDTLCL